MNIFLKMWKKVYNSGVLERVGRVTVNSSNCFSCLDGCRNGWTGGRLDSYIKP